jgi:hypothetical protein
MSGLRYCPLYVAAVNIATVACDVTGEAELCSKITIFSAGHLTTASEDGLNVTRGQQRVMALRLFRPAAPPVTEKFVQRQMTATKPV